MTVPAAPVEGLRSPSRAKDLDWDPLCPGPELAGRCRETARLPSQQPASSAWWTALQISAVFGRGGSGPQGKTRALGPGQGPQ